MSALLVADRTYSLAPAETEPCDICFSFGCSHTRSYEMSVAVLRLYGLHNLRSSPNVIRMMKPKNMR
jgi:hypothetical protein